MRPESRRRPRTASPRLEGLETLVLLNGDLAVVPESTPAPEAVEPLSTPDQPAEAGDVSSQPTDNPNAVGGDLILSASTGEDQDDAAPEAADSSTPPVEESAPAPSADEAAQTPSDPLPVDETPPAPPAEEVAPAPPVAEAPTAPIDPVEPPPPPPVAPPSPPPSTDAVPSPSAPTEAVPISAPATPPPVQRVEVTPTAENLRIDLAVERTSNLAGKLIRFHTRETNVGADPIRLPALNDFDVVVEQNGAIVWKLSDVRRTRAALLKPQAFEPLASRGVSVWWDGFRSRGGRAAVSGEVVVYSTMDGVESARQAIHIDPTPVNTPRPAPQPVRVEVLPTTPPPATATPAATATTPSAPTTGTTTAAADPVPTASPSASAGSSAASAGSSASSSTTTTSSTPPLAGSTSTTSTTPSPGGSTSSPASTPTNGSNTPPPASTSTHEDPTDAATTGQPEITTQVGGRRRWNTASYGAVGQAWKQKRFQVPRPTNKPLSGVQQGIRAARLARVEALANRLT